MTPKQRKNKKKSDLQHSNATKRLHNSKSKEAPTIKDKSILHIANPQSSKKSPNDFSNCNIPLSQNTDITDIIEPINTTPGSLIHEKNIITIPWLQNAATLWTGFLTTIFSTLALNVVSAVFGLNSFGPAPVIDLIHRFPTFSIILSILFVGISLTSWFITPKPQKGKEPTLINATVSAKDPPLTKKLVISIAISIINTTSCVALILTIMLKPTWCPNILCPAPQPILDLSGAHDQNLEISLTTIQSSNFLLGNNPAQYSAKSLNTHIGAVRIDSLATDPYRVVLRVHSLQRGKYGMYIEGASLIVDKIIPSPQPLNVLYTGNTLDYRSNIYLMKYTGQSIGEAIYGSYKNAPGGFVQLAPGESDDLDLEVFASFPVTLQFRIQVTYRAYDEFQMHTLTLPTEFEIAVSDKTNWHPYIIKNGRLTLFSNQKSRER